MTSLLAISITINLAIIAVVTFFKKHKLLQIIYNKNTYQEYETIFNSIFKYFPSTYHFIELIKTLNTHLEEKSTIYINDIPNFNDLLKFKDNNKFNTNLD